MSTWILHVKNYQKDHNVTYKEALKLASPTYQKKEKKGSGIIQDIGEKIINIKNVIFDPMKALEKVPKLVQEVLNKNGSSIIKQITIYRNPVQTLYTTILNVLTLGDFLNEAKKKGYDNLFHLFMTVRLDNGNTLLLERNARVNIVEVKSPIIIKEGGYILPVKLKKNVSLNNFLTNGEKANSSSIPFYVYHAVKNNCQRFINDLLVGNDLITPDLETFVLQDIETLIKSPLLNTLTKGLTNVANITQNVIAGGCKNKKKKTRNAL